MTAGRAWGFTLLLLLVLAACAEAERGDPTRGAAVFKGELGGTVPCSECHNVAPGPLSPLGPSLEGIGDRAGDAVFGQSARAYLRESIVDPDAHLAGGFQEGIMPRIYDDTLTAEQVDDLVAYMLTLTQ